MDMTTIEGLTSDYQKIITKKILCSDTCTDKQSETDIENQIKKVIRSMKTEEKIKQLSSIAGTMNRSQEENSASTIKEMIPIDTVQKTIGALIWVSILKDMTDYFDTDKERG